METCFLHLAITFSESAFSTSIGPLKNRIRVLKRNTGRSEEELRESSVQWPCTVWERPSARRPPSLVGTSSSLIPFVHSAPHRHPQSRVRQVCLAARRGVTKYATGPFQAALPDWKGHARLC